MGWGPFTSMMTGAQVMAVGDGPTEVHEITLATQRLKGDAPHEGLFPSAHLPTRREAARARYADLIEHTVGNE